MTLATRIQQHLALIPGRTSRQLVMLFSDVDSGNLTSKLSAMVKRGVLTRQHNGHVYVYCNRVVEKSSEPV